MAFGNLDRRHLMVHAALANKALTEGLNYPNGGFELP